MGYHNRATLAKRNFKILFPLDKRIVIKMKLALVFMLSLWMVVGAHSIPMPSMEMIQKSAEFPNGFSLEEEEPLIDENTPDIPEEVIFSEVRNRRNIDEIVDHVLQEVRAKEPELLWDDVARYPHVAFGEMDNDKLVKRSTDIGADYVVFDDKDHDDHDEDHDHDHDGPCDHEDHEKDHEEEDHHDEEEEEISSENLEKLKLDENVLNGYQIPE